MQQRHDGPSDEVARKTVIAQLADGGQGHRHRPPHADHALGGRPRPASSASAWASPRSPRWSATRGRAAPKAALWTTGWTPGQRRDRLPAPRHRRSRTRSRWSARRTRSRARWRRCSRSASPSAVTRRRCCTALRRVRQPGHADPAAPGHAGRSSAPGQENFHYGDFYAYSKICTHLGCPTSLYETQTQRILCPCHQSQFIATEYAKPVFGPAARAAAATSDYSERRGLPRRHRRLPRRRRSGLLGVGSRRMSSITTPDQRRAARWQGQGGRGARRARPALPPGRRAAQAVQQGLPDALVVHARRGRALQLHRAAAVGHLPRAVLRPVDDRGRLRRAVRQPARRAR